MSRLLSRLAAPFLWAWSAARGLFGLLHRLLVLLAWPLGVNAEDWRYRYALFGSLFGLVYLLGYFAPTPVALAALGVGIVWVVAVSQAWSANEQRRIDIAR